MEPKNREGSIGLPPTKTLSGDGALRASKNHEGRPRPAEAPETTRPVLALRRREWIRLRLRAGADSAGSEGRRMGRARRRRPNATVLEEHCIHPRGARSHVVERREDDGLPGGPCGFPSDERGIQGILSGGPAGEVS